MRKLFLSMVVVCALTSGGRAQEQDEEAPQADDESEEQAELRELLSKTLIQEEGEWTEAPATRATPPDAGERKARLKQLLKECRTDYGLSDADGEPKMEYGKRVPWHAWAHFRMPIYGPTPDEAQTKILNAIKWELPKDRQISLHRATWGRASCEEVAYLTQRMIDAGKLATEALGGWGPQIRKTMWDHGIGLDCVGYVGWALIRAWGRDDLGSGVVGTGILGGFGFAKNRKFKKLASPVDAESGDVIDLDKQDGQSYGHVVIVVEHRVLTSEGVTTEFGKHDFLAQGPIHNFVVHSSWGAGGKWNAKDAGAGERRWLYNEATGKWADVNTESRTSQLDYNPNGPYKGHPVLGVYRPK